MPDIVDAATRSRMMAGIRGKDTQPELRVRRRLHALGLRYRLHARDLAGRPDLVFPGRRTVLFVHGCFWHQHPGCRLAAKPDSNGAFWATKLRRNVERDHEAIGRLQALGWDVYVVWECAASEAIDELGARLVGRQTSETRSSYGPASIEFHPRLPGAPAAE